MEARVKDRMKPRQPTSATERNGQVKVLYILALTVILAALLACTEATPNTAPTTAPSLAETQAPGPREHCRDNGVTSQLPNPGGHRHPDVRAHAGLHVDERRTDTGLHTPGTRGHPDRDDDGPQCAGRGRKWSGVRGIRADDS